VESYRRIPSRSLRLALRTSGVLNRRAPDMLTSAQLRCIDEDREGHEETSTPGGWIGVYLRF